MPTQEVVTKCARIAARQFGIIARWQAEACGLSKYAICRLVAQGAWNRVHPSVFSLWVPSAPAEVWRHRLTAAALWLGSSSAVSRRAAGVLFGLDGIDSTPLEFVTTSHKRKKAPGLIIHRTSSLPVTDITTRDGLRVTEVARTIVELAAVLRPANLERALESALHLGLTTIEELSDALERAGPTHKGRRALLAVLRAHTGVPTESEFETRLWQLLRRKGLPLPTRQYEVLDDRGRVVARPDFAYVDIKFAIEADGFGSHSSPEQLRSDRTRQNDLVRRGWTIYRITWFDLVRRGDVVAAEIAELYERCRRLSEVESSA